jgi:hypothetical protein
VVWVGCQGQSANTFGAQPVHSGAGQFRAAFRTCSSRHKKLGKAVKPAVLNSTEENHRNYDERFAFIWI